MRWWEILLIIQGYRRRNVLQYQLQRIQAWSAAFCMGNKENKRPEDLVGLYCDHYIEEPEDTISKEEVDEMKATMSSINKANGF